ncbi:MAG TPA: hydroxymethylbilane synthase [Chthoniobacterales bacterium]|nr:hydroxymethylbilane synthase [Chthoniobacterales bacterium]
MKIVIGTRGSELARTQAQMVSDVLRGRWSQLTIETKVIRTSGDERKIDMETSRAGRKGLFTAEIERALLAEDVDLAVHSAKDLPSELSAGTDIAAVLPRAPTDDVLAAIEPWNMESLPGSAIVATGSVRRKHQLRWKRPDLDIVDLRGNVPTRLRKLATNQWHAIVLARAGLDRLGHNIASGHIYFEGSEFFTEVLPEEIFLPAGGQGVIGIQIRSKDERAQLLLEPLNDFDTRLCLRAEREFLRLLHGDCNQPVGVLATINATVMKMRAQVFDLEATTPREAVVEGPSKDAERLAAQLLREINVQ